MTRRRREFPTMLTLEASTENVRQSYRGCAWEWTYAFVEVYCPQASMSIAMEAVLSKIVNSVLLPRTPGLRAKKGAKGR